MSSRPIALSTVENEEAEVAASEALVRGMAKLMDHDAVAQILSQQHNAYESFRRANKTLQEFNDESAQAFGAVSGDFEVHTKRVLAMKRDLDFVFKRIHALRQLMAAEFPDVPIVDHGDDEEQDDDSDIVDL
jgi:Uncharacterized conserved protein